MMELYKFTAFIQFQVEYNEAFILLDLRVAYDPPVNYRFECDEPCQCEIISASYSLDSQPFRDLKWLTQTHICEIESLAAKQHDEWQTHILR